MDRPWLKQSALARTDGVAAPVRSETKRKRILYVEREWSAIHVPDAYMTVLNGLRERYEVETGYDLSHEFVDRVEQAKADNPFDGIVTHAPNTPGTSSYGKSLSILCELRETVEIPIIVYTGASPDFSRLLMYEYVDGLVPKSSDADEDLKAIISVLERRWEAQKQEVSVAPPLVTRSDGRTLVDAVVNIRCGIGLPGIAKIVTECCAFSGEIMLTRTDLQGGGATGSCKDVMDILMLALEEGASVRISVEGTDAQAERLMRWIYGGITSLYGYDMQFERFLVMDADGMSEPDSVKAE